MADLPKQTNPWKIGFLILAIAVVLWIGYAVAVPRFAMSWEKSNQFGGMFGGIGALFSGLALAGVVVAILMQREELALQRQESKRQSAAQELTSRAMLQQIQLMIAATKLSAHTALLEYETQTPHFAKLGPSTSEAVANIQRLLTEINLMSTDPPAGSR